MTQTEAARLALLALYAYDMHASCPDTLAPPPDPRLAPEWRLLGYIIGKDALFRAHSALELSELTCYGYVAQSTADPTVFIAAIRGTNGIIEWIEDAEFLPMAHPVAGKVESGFFALFSSLVYTPAGTADLLPLVTTLPAIVKGGALRVLGHSLGAPLAAYLAFALAGAGGGGDRRVAALLFACPRPGDSAFGAAFAEAVPDSVIWNYELDIVPRVPFGPDYADLPGVQWITLASAQARIAFSITAHHHLLCYAAMLDYGLLDWAKVPAIDQGYAACIKGPC